MPTSEVGLSREEDIPDISDPSWGSIVLAVLGNHRKALQVGLNDRNGLSWFWDWTLRLGLVSLRPAPLACRLCHCPVSACTSLCVSVS